MRGNYEEEGYLDDGDLPSLTPKGSNSISSHNQDSTASERTMTKRVSYNNGLKSKTDMNGRQFWDQLDDESAGEGHDGSTTNNNGNHAANFDNGATGNNHYDDDGPDDEMAARRSVVITPPDTGPLKRSDTDNSAPTDNESHLTDEDIEEEPYETSFCGQTLNAIEDMCGGTLNVTGSNIDASKRNNARRSSTTSPPMERKRRSPDYPLSADNSRSPRRDYPPISELQQENTAIEVEYMEPIKKSTSVGSDSGVTSEIKKKTVRLNAIAKKAKEKFRSKKGKSSAHSIGSEQSNDQRGMLLQQEIGSAVADDAASKSNFSAGATIGDTAESTITSNTRSLDVAEQVDTDYNSFNAAEKRKFIKLINSGVVATDATRQVLEERAKAIEPVNVVDDDDIVLDDASEIGNLDYDVMMEGMNSPATQAPPIVEPNVDISTSSASTIPFKKSGSVYYDAVRRNVDDNNDSADVEIVEDVNHMGRPPSGFKGLEFGVAQRFFGGGKPKGFAALPDSPQQRSTTIVDKPLEYENPMENFGSGPVNTNNLQHPKDKDMSSSTSFDSFVRNRVVADPADLSMDNYQMTPTRELAKLHPEQSPESGISTIVNSEAESTLSHSNLNNTADIENEKETQIPASQFDLGRDVSHMEVLEHSRVYPQTHAEHDEEEPHSTTDDKYREVSQLEEQGNEDSFISDREVQERSVGDNVSQVTSQIVQDEHEQIEEQSQGISFISTADREKFRIWI